jgi:hypothetical protein
VGFGDGPKDVADEAVVDGSVDAVAGGVPLQAVATARMVRRLSSFGFIPRVSNVRGDAASDIVPVNCYAGGLGSCCVTIPISVRPSFAAARLW